MNIVVDYIIQLVAKVGRPKKDRDRTVQISQLCFSRCIEYYSTIHTAEHQRLHFLLQVEKPCIRICTKKRIHFAWLKRHDSLHNELPWVCQLVDLLCA